MGKKRGSIVATGGSRARGARSSRTISFRKDRAKVLLVFPGVRMGSPFCAPPAPRVRPECYEDHPLRMGQVQTPLRRGGSVGDFLGFLPGGVREAAAEREGWDRPRRRRPGRFPDPLSVLCGVGTGEGSGEATFVSCWQWWKLHARGCREKRRSRTPMRERR